MKHFLRTTDQNNAVELVIALMQRQDRFKYNGQAGVSSLSIPQADIPSLTVMTLNAQAMAYAADRKDARVLRCEPGTAVTLGSRGIVALLQSQPGHPVILSCGDEAVYSAMREVWYFEPPGEAQLLNKTDDDVLALVVTLDEYSGSTAES
jgi:hypothetical protein